MGDSGKMVTGLLGGSFNPVHIGHMIVASYIAQWGYADEVWLNLSPRNPLKSAADLASDEDRLAMLRIALGGCDSLGLCDIELSMPRPSYTIDTLYTLARKYPERHFKVIIGSDNWQIFDRWRDADRIINDYGVIVYPRPGYAAPDADTPGVTVADAPMVELSSTLLRQAIARGRDVDYMVPTGVYNYIKEHQLYQQ